MTKKAAQEQRICLRNQSGMRAVLSNLGGTLVSIEVPDRDGKPGEVLLGFETADAYREQDAYIGASIGPIANRISGASYPWAGGRVEMEANEGPNCLHSASAGFDRQVWTVGECLEDAVRMELRTPAGRGGFPAAYTVGLQARLLASNSLVLRYILSADRSVFVNLTQHAYFNLNPKAPTILNHLLRVPAAEILETDAAKLPTGRRLDVGGTAFDLREAVRLGARITSAFDYDHAYVLETADGGISGTRRPAYAETGVAADAAATGAAIRLAAELCDPDSGRCLRLYSDQPCLQVYSGKYLPNLSGHGGKRYGAFAGLALEPEFYLDAPNRPEFPQRSLAAGAIYETTLVYAFSVDDAPLPA